MSQGAVDSSVDMDRLNRNIMPECGRQTHQVLQVSVWGRGETTRRGRTGMSQKERERPHCSQAGNPPQKNTVFPFACFQCGHIYTHSTYSLLLITVSIDVKCQHIACSGRFVALKVSVDDKYRAEGVTSTAGTRPDNICQYVVKQESSARVSN